MQHPGRGQAGLAARAGSVFSCPACIWSAMVKDTMKRSAGLIAGLALAALRSAPRVRADDAVSCFGEDIEGRIAGCTALIERRDSSVAEMSAVYAMRALAYSLKGQYATAIGDYDTAITMRPDFAVALNNRAWAYFRWGKAATGLPDVEKSLQLSPTSAAFARYPRAHPPGPGRAAGGAARLHQGDVLRRRADDQALPVRADRSRPLHRRGRRRLAARSCRTRSRPACSDKACDPLPADEHCRAATS